MSAFPPNSLSANNTTPPVTPGRIQRIGPNRSDGKGPCSFAAHIVTNVAQCEVQHAPGSAETCQLKESTTTTTMNHLAVRDHNSSPNWCYTV